MLKAPFLVLCFASAAFTCESDSRNYFKSIEHEWLGEIARLDFPGNENTVPTEHKLRMPNGNSLSYGDIIALAGDYYGVADTPISDGKSDTDRLKRFVAAFAELADEEKSATCDNDYCANKLLEIFASEKEAHKESGLGGPVPSRSASTMVSIELYTANNFLRLAIRNWDHFLPTSMIAYETGHGAALQQALKARSLRKPSAQLAALELAYAMNAFADHYLTDMFSSGHLRVPRRELFEQSSLGSLGGLLAGQMHDEDGRVGLVVHNSEGKTWKMYGDGLLFVAGAEENKKQVALAVQTSASEIARAFKTGEVVSKENYGIKKIVPQVDEALLNPRTPDLNSSPLYSKDATGRVLARTPENSRCSYEWTADWTGISQLVGYRSAGDGSDCKFNNALEE